MNFELPLPGSEALYHPPRMTWAELCRLQNIRPFLGWTTYPTTSYEDWMSKYTSENCPVYDRLPGRPEFEFHGVINDGPHQGGYVSVDAHTLIMAPTLLRPGLYHHHAQDREWNYYEDPDEAPRPSDSYGFYRSVVDLGFEARGQVWDLFLAMREPMKPDDTRPGILIVARKDYGFSIPPGYRPHDVQWTASCECSSLIKVGDYTIPENGCLEFRDKIAHGIPKSAGHFEVLSGAGDGIYPVEIIKDTQGSVVCVKVRFDGRGDVNVDPGTGPVTRSTVFTFAPAVNHASNCEVPEPLSPRVRKSRRKSAGEMIHMTKGFFREIGSVARRAML